MPYSTKAEVKSVLMIDASDVSMDTEIEACITDADTRIDNRLSNHESSLPLGSVPSSINVASKYFAAALMKQRREPSAAEAAAVYEKIALTYLEEYITETYFGGKFQ